MQSVGLPANALGIRHGRQALRLDDERLTDLTIGFWGGEFVRLRTDQNARQHGPVVGLLSESRESTEDVAEWPPRLTCCDC